MPLWSARPSAFDPSLRLCGFARRIFSVAPKEQNVYSPHIPLTLPAPLGAECKLTPACTLRSAGAQSDLGYQAINIVLLWSTSPESRFKPLFGLSPSLR